MADDARLRVSVVQTESSLDPAVNRARLDEAAELAPASDLVVFPEAFARDFGKPGSDLAAVRRAARRPVRHPAARGLRPARRGACWPACSRQSGEGALPFNTLVLADRGVLTTYRKIHLYDSFGYRESDTRRRRCHRAGRGRRARRAGRADDLLRPAVPRARPGARRRRRRGARRPRGLGRWRAQGDALDARSCAPGRSRTSCTSSGAAQCGPRYTGHSLVFSPYGDAIVEADNRETVLHASLDLTEVATAREANPSLANRRL